MKTANLMNIIKKRNITIPLYIFNLRDKFNLDLEEFIFLIYLSNYGDKVLLDVNLFSQELNISLEKILTLIDNLDEKKLINIKIIKNDKNISSEYIILDLFYNKLLSFLTVDINSNDNSDNHSIFSEIEKEFGRTLSPVEVEIITAWIDTGYSEELISEALKETVFSGVSNLRYMDKILYEWNKSGFKNKEDIDNNRKKYKEQQEKEKLDLFDYNWFDEDNDDE